jgi:hypothetical protein
MLLISPIFADYSYEVQHTAQQKWQVASGTVE